ncbi:MAG: hypothetical protein PHT69_16045 [Bacteroidales bacterium]|nr:hypothetical protein [Bacteroidales bacterium]
MALINCCLSFDFLNIILVAITTLATLWGIFSWKSKIIHQKKMDIAFNFLKDLNNLKFYLHQTLHPYILPYEIDRIKNDNYSNTELFCLETIFKAKVISNRILEIGTVLVDFKSKSYMYKTLFKNSSFDNIIDYIEKIQCCSNTLPELQKNIKNQFDYKSKIEECYKILQFNAKTHLELDFPILDNAISEINKIVIKL